MSEREEMYACLYAEEFPAQTLLRLRPKLDAAPYVVMEGDAPLQHVCSLNQKARALGLQHGMTRVEVDSFDGVMAGRRSRSEEAAAESVLLECAGKFSPRVELCPAEAALVCVLDIAGMQTLFGSPANLAQSLFSDAERLGFAVTVAVSHNFHAAVALARGLAQGSVHVVAAGSACADLAPLPLDVLDLTEEQMETFGLWGIRTLGMLAALPERELIARMGQAGKQLRRQARGEAAHLFQPVETPLVLSEYMELDSPLEMLDALLFVVNGMLEQLILRASARGFALASVAITLLLDGGATHTRRVAPALPSSDRALWVKLLHLDLESHLPPAAIVAVTLEAEPGSTSKVQLGLFSPQLPEPSRLDVTLARIGALIGEDNVGCAILRDTHRPDAFRMETFRIPPGEPEQIAARPARPALRRLRPAEAVFVTLQHARPQAFLFRKRRYAVERAYGPWATSGDWWNASLWGAEQWDLVARSAEGAALCCCVMRDVLRNQWHMVGSYD